MHHDETSPAGLPVNDVSCPVLTTRTYAPLHTKTIHFCQQFIVHNVHQTAQARSHAENILVFCYLDASADQTLGALQVSDGAKAAFVRDHRADT